MPSPIPQAVRARAAAPLAARSTPRPSRRAPAWKQAGALGLLLLAPLAGCDNPACVFGGDCSGTGGPSGSIGAEPATLPEDGERLLPTAPSVVLVSPSGQGADTRTPIVIVFDEAMSPSGMNTAFRIMPVGSTFAEAPYTAALIGNQRVLVLLPTSPLQAQTSYDVRYRENVDVQDRTGQPLLRPAGTDLAGGFTVGAANGTVPKLVATFPSDDSIGEPATTEIVAVFDRPLDPDTVTTSSFVVTVDGDPPAATPLLQALSAAGGAVSDTRVWRYQTTDDQGLAAPLGLDAEVSVSLSPAGHPIEDAGGGDLAPTSFAFTTLPFSAPSSAAISSHPEDAIGIDDLTGPADLAVEVGLPGAQAGDRLEVYLFGTRLGTTPNQPLGALFRDLEIEAPFDPATLVASELDLLLSESPLEARFQDGPVAFAFQLKRGTLRSALRRLDVDPDTDGPQDPLLDTVAPVLEGLSTSGGIVDSFRSDQRDLAIVGRASEPVRAVLVVTPLGSNQEAPGEPPPVVGSDAEGLFVAAPVALGIVPPASLPLDYEVTVYDRAFNAAPPVSGGFVQQGASGPGDPLPGPTVEVQVFDVTTGLPVADALVFTHDFAFDLVLPVASGTTSAAGSVTLGAALAGDTIVTVDARAAGYALFTFEGVPTSRLGVPLEPDALATATSGGVVATTDVDLNFYQRRVADARSSELAAKLFPVNACAPDPVDQRFECPFGPLPIRPRRLGSQTALAVVPPANPFLYSALSFLKAFELSLPLPPVAPGGSAANALVLPFLFDDPGLDPEELPIDVLPHVLSSAAHPVLAGAPQVTVEGTAPGLPGPVVVGAGVAFENTPLVDSYTVRAAYPGAADGIQDVPEDLLGRLVEAGTIDADLHLRCEIVAADGTRAGARPRLSTSTLLLEPPAAPALADPPVALNLGAEALDLSFADVLPDLGGPSGTGGLYRISMTDAAGQRWIAWRLDPSGGAPGSVTVHLPFVGPGPSWPLQPGLVATQVSGFAWPAFDPALFLWSDVEREEELYVHGVPETFAYP